LAAGIHSVQVSNSGTLSNIVQVLLANGSFPANQAPVVNAGPDQSITLPSSASLSGMATDDGWPLNSRLTTAWSLVSGPAPVTISEANATSASATFSTNGTYTIRLTATDGALSSSDDVVVMVAAA